MAVQQVHTLAYVGGMQAGWVGAPAGYRFAAGTLLDDSTSTAVRLRRRVLTSSGCPS